MLMPLAWTVGMWLLVGPVSPRPAYTPRTRHCGDDGRRSAARIKDNWEIDCHRPTGSVVVRATLRDGHCSGKAAGERVDSAAWPRATRLCGDAGAASARGRLV